MVRNSQHMAMQPPGSKARARQAGRAGISRQTVHLIMCLLGLSACAFPSSVAGHTLAPQADALPGSDSQPSNAGQPDPAGVAVPKVCSWYASQQVRLNAIARGHHAARGSPGVFAQQQQVPITRTSRAYHKPQHNGSSSGAGDASWVLAQLLRAACVVARVWVEHSAAGPAQAASGQDSNAAVSAGGSSSNSHDDGSSNSHDDGSSNSHDDGSSNSHDDGSSNSHDNGSGNSHDDGSSNSHDDGGSSSSSSSGQDDGANGGETAASGSSRSDAGGSGNSSSDDGDGSGALARPDVVLAALFGVTDTGGAAGVPGAGGGVFAGQATKLNQTADTGSSKHTVVTGASSRRGAKFCQKPSSW